MLDLKSLATKLPPPPANGAGAVAVSAAKAEAAMAEAEVLLRLDDELRERLERQRKIVATGRAAREFGVTVDIAMVARIALIRGLERMEGVAGTGEASVTVSADGAVSADDAVSADPIGQAHEGPPAWERLDVDYNEDGEIVPPEGWNKWNGTERVPPEQQEVHDYYLERGLWRWWGKSGEQIFTFYWSPKPGLHDVSPFEKQDANGKNVARQITPWGPGHILPAGWGLRPG